MSRIQLACPSSNQGMTCEIAIDRECLISSQTVDFLKKHIMIIGIQDRIKTGKVIIPNKFFDKLFFSRITHKIQTHKKDK